jgi:hypothetical protein
VKHQRHFDNVDNVVKQHLILGTDSQDAENQKDLWLSQNPAIRVVQIHEVTREPETLLTRIGRKHVPRVSITVEYEEPDAPVELKAFTAAPPPDESDHEKYSQNSVRVISRSCVARLKLAKFVHLGVSRSLRDDGRK